MHTTHHLRLVVNKENYPKCISYTLHLPSAKAGWTLLRKQGDEGKACIKSLPLIRFWKIQPRSSFQSLTFSSGTRIMQIVNLNKLFS